MYYDVVFLSIHLFSTTLPLRGLRKGCLSGNQASLSWSNLTAPKFSQWFCTVSVHTFTFHHVFNYISVVNRVFKVFFLLHVLICFLPVRFGEDLEHLAELAWWVQGARTYQANLGKGKRNRMMHGMMQWFRWCNWTGVLTGKDVRIGA